MKPTLLCPCDQISSTIEAAFSIADDFFLNHMSSQVVMSPSPWEAQGIIRAKDDKGRQQQLELNDILTKLRKQMSLAGMPGEAYPFLASCELLFKEGGAWRGPMQSHSILFSDWMNQIRQLAENLVDDTPGEILLVADSNALLHFPAIENWSFEGIPKFTLVLPSTVLNELDSFENSNKNERVRDKAARLVRQLKEYRSRGRLHDGVTIVRDRIVLRVMPLEPVISATSGLDLQCNDDRILARMIRLIREHPRCAVALVTRDINLQTKADYRDLPVVEAPSPMAT